MVLKPSACPRRRLAPRVFRRTFTLSTHGAPFTVISRRPATADVCLERLGQGLSALVAASLGVAGCTSLTAKLALVSFRTVDRRRGLTETRLLRRRPLIGIRFPRASRTGFTALGDAGSARRATLQPLRGDVRTSALVFSMTVNRLGVGGLPAPEGRETKVRWG